MIFYWLFWPSICPCDYNFFTRSPSNFHKCYIKFRIFFSTFFSQQIDNWISMILVQYVKGLTSKSTMIRPMNTFVFSSNLPKKLLIQMVLNVFTISIIFILVIAILGKLFNLLFLPIFFFKFYYYLVGLPGFDF